MNNQKTFQGIIQLVENWEQQLSSYTIEALLKKSDAESWSMGQVYMHLINATLNFQLKQVSFCLNTDENQSKRKNFKGFISYHILGKFPPIKIKVPASEAYSPKQPESVAQILEGFAEVKREVKLSLAMLTEKKGKGKTEHPGFSYLNASEWFKLVEMHIRHHLAQKKRIDEFLGK